MDVQVKIDGQRATVTGETDQGEEFVEAWLLGVLAVEDFARVTITSEFVGDLRRAAAEQGLTVGVD